MGGAGGLEYTSMYSRCGDSTTLLLLGGKQNNRKTNREGLSSTMAKARLMYSTSPVSALQKLN